MNSFHLSRNYFSQESVCDYDKKVNKLPRCSLTYVSKLEQDTKIDFPAVVAGEMELVVLFTARLLCFCHVRARVCARQAARANSLEGSY